MAMIGLLLSTTVLLGPAAAADSDPADLRQIGQIWSKGRVQDQHNRVVEALISAGPRSVPFLVSKIEDDTEIQGHVLDFWPVVHVGDVAFFVLCELLTLKDQVTPAVPGLSWDSVLGRRDQDTDSYSLYLDFVARHRRSGIRRKVESLLKPYEGRLVWDVDQRCFRPAQ